MSRAVSRECGGSPADLSTAAQGAGSELLCSGWQFMDNVDRNFYVGECKEQETFPIASADVSPLHGEFHLSRRNADEVSWKHLAAEERTQS